MSEEPRREQSEVVSRARPKRWWRDLRWITAGVITISLAFLAWGLFGPEPPIRVSRETTYFTEPLAADGLPDYRAAILAMAGPAPPPEVNAAAGLLQVCWPLGIPDSHLPAVCKALGIPCVAPEQPLREPHRDAASKISRDDFAAALAQPWTSADLPELAAWLSANEASIDRVVAACDRPRYWLPRPSLLHDETGLIVTVLFQEPSAFWEAAHVLTCRATWHLGKGRHAEAWRDVRTIYRLARLLAAPVRRGECVMPPIVAGHLEAMAYDVMTRALLADDALPHELLADVRRDLQGLGRANSFPEFFPAERAMVIDLVVFMACRAPGGRAGRAGALSPWVDVRGRELAAAFLPRTSIDWNIVLKHGNEAFDGYESAWNLLTFKQRRHALEHVDRDVRDRAKSWESAWNLPLVLCNRGARSECLGSPLLASLIAALSAVVNLTTATEARFTLVETAAALEAWRLDHASAGKAYPERLDELVPMYLSDVPIDPFSDKPLVYERRGGGYLLASVGENCVYDGGTDESGWIFKGEWESKKREYRDDYEDVVVRMPVPKRPFKQRETP